MPERSLTELDQQLADLGLPPDELEERFVRSGGPGGQHANKSSTAVQLHHRPSGMEVRVESERSQMQNRVEARQRLILKVQAARKAEAEAKKAAQEKARRRNRRPSAAARKRNVEKKRKRSTVKRNRKRVSREEE